MKASGINYEAMNNYHANFAISSQGPALGSRLGLKTGYEKERNKLKMDMRESRWISFCSRLRLSEALNQKKVQ